MLELKIEIKVPDLAAAISRLADAVAPGAPIANCEPAPAPAAPVMAAAPAAAPTEQPVAPSAAPVPVSAPTYTLDQIARAGASLVDAGKMDQLLALLAKYGMTAVTQLQPGQFGVFATELRALGAQI